MSQIKMVVETSLIGTGLRSGVALGPVGRLAVLGAEAHAWALLRALTSDHATTGSPARAG